jgi:hypothetical protein
MQTLSHFIGSHIRVILLTIAVIVSILGEIKEWFRKHKLFRWLIIIFILGAASAQYYNDEEDTTNHIKEYQTTIAKADTTLKKLSSTYDNIRAVQDNIDKQLVLQKAITVKANLLSRQNQEITKKQEGVYKNVDRIINPLFPLHFYVSMSVSFQNDNVIALRDSILKLKTTFDATHKFIDSINGISFLKTLLGHDNDNRIDTSEMATAFKPIKLFNNDIEQKMLKLCRFELSIVKANTYMNFYIPGATDKFNKNDIIDITADFSHKKFYITVEYFHVEYLKDTWNPSTGILGFNDLANSKFIIRPILYKDSYEITVVSFGPENGLEKYYLFSLTPKDRLYTNQCWEYRHMITLEDLSDNIETERFKIPVQKKIGNRK